jgi:excinuclease ABC subunit A
MQKKARECGEKAGQFSELSGSFCKSNILNTLIKIHRKKFAFQLVRISKHTMTFGNCMLKENYRRGYQAKHFSLMLMVDDVKLVKERVLRNVFMADVMPCETCSGKRFKKEVLKSLLKARIFTIYQ